MVHAVIRGLLLPSKALHKRGYLPYLESLTLLATSLILHLFGPDHVIYCLCTFVTSFLRSLEYIVVVVNRFRGILVRNYWKY